VHSATRMRDRLGYIFGPPGWQPAPAIRPEVSTPLASSR